MHMLIEIHHLEAVELIRHLLDILLLIRLLHLDTFGVPALNKRPLATSSGQVHLLDLLTI